MRPCRFLLVFAVLLSGSAFLHGQDAPSPDAPPVGIAAPADDASQDAPITTLKVSANLVSIFFTVRDKHNALIPDLTRSDCAVYENRQLQTIKNFETETNLPLTLGILLDTSGSQMNVLPLEQQAGSAFLKDILTPKDEAFLISFDVNVNLLSDYTSNARDLERAMNKAQINTAGGGGSVGVPGIGQGPVPTIGAPKGTLLYDAVYLASHDKLSSETGRKALIILTDGEDQGSQEKLSGAIEAAQRANAIVYVILIADRGFYGGMGGFGYSGDSVMRKLASETGGRVIDVGNNGKKLQAAFDQIDQELRTQYLVSYTPEDKKLDGSYRTVQIQCGKDLRVQSRKGYYAVAQNQ